MATGEEVVGIAPVTRGQRHAGALGSQMVRLTMVILLVEEAGLLTNYSRHAAIGAP